MGLLRLILFNFSYIAKDTESIKELLNEPTSRMVYIIIAQALDEKVPLFILQMYGTNNKFFARDVVRRWSFTKTELERFVVLIIVVLIVLLFYDAYC